MAKIRTLQVRPLHSADLSFEIGGVLGYRDPTRAMLGAEPGAFSLPDLVLRLGQRDANGRHVFDADRIRAEFAPAVLFQLRNDLSAAAMQQAIAQCEVAYLQTYQHRDRISRDFREVYPNDPSAATGKLARLELLRDLSNRHTIALKTAYENTQLKDVVTDTVTVSRNTGNQVSTTLLTPVAMRNTPHTITVRNSPANSDQTISESSSIPLTWLSDDNWQPIKTPPLSFASQQTNTANDLTNVSNTRNPEYRHPYLENLMQDQRSNLSLQDELLMNRSFALRVPSLERILDREFETLDLEVRKSQVRFLQTFLTSPTAGTITAIYKDIGESVQPGEPVLRVENAARVLLTGVVQHRGLVTLKQSVALATRNPYETGSSLSPEIVYEGAVVAVRGHDADDDEWDLVIECDNSRYHLPINYHFDRDTTRIEFR